MSPEAQQSCVDESRVLSRLKSPHITKYYDSFLHRNAGGSKLYIVMEYLPGGTLQDLCDAAEAKGKRLSERWVWKALLQTCANPLPDRPPEKR